MLNFLIRRLGMLVGTMLAVSLLTFLLLEVNGDAVVVKVIGPYSTQEQREIWLEANGYNEPAAMRYVTWLWDVMRGDFGESIRYRAQVADVLWPRWSSPS